MAKLNNATDDIAKKVADKIAGKSKSKTDTTPTNATVTVPTQHDANVAVTIPGLNTLTPDTVSSQLPHFASESYHINDPLNPPDTLPQATEAQYQRGMNTYQGSQRALKLTGAAFDTTREKFNVIGKQAKAIGAGIVAATEIEKVRGNYLDYQNQLQVTQQKGVSLDVNLTKTVTDRNIAIHTKINLAEKLKQAEIKSQESTAKTLEAQGKLTAFKQQLGEYLPK